MNELKFQTNLRRFPFGVLNWHEEFWKEFFYVYIYLQINDYYFSKYKYKYVNRYWTPGRNNSGTNCVQKRFSIEKSNKEKFRINKNKNITTDLFIITNSFRALIIYLKLRRVIKLDCLFYSIPPKT